MPFSTLSDLLSSVTRGLSQVPGIGVQTFSQDRIADFIENAFDLAYNERWWPNLMQYQMLTLNGTNGHTNEAQTCTDYTDYRAIFRANYDRPLPQIPLGINPARYYKIGGVARWIESDSTVTGQVFRVLPLLATGTLTTHFRKMPTRPFTLNSTVPLDAMLMRVGAIYQYLEDDGTNPGATTKYENMFQKRLSQLENSLDAVPISLDPRVNDIPDQWREF